MTIKSAPFYWVECDHDGCKQRTPSEGCEISAWADEDQAGAGADDDGWATTDDCKHYCEDHHPDNEEPQYDG